MSEQTPNPNPNPAPLPGDEPFIPPQYLLYVTAAGLIVALYVLVTQGPQSVVFWGGLGFAVLATAAWALMAPEHFRTFLQGRFVRFGGTSILVTVVFLIAMVVVYEFVKGRSWRYDITQANQYSLTSQSRDLVRTISADPNIPPIKILAFYDASQSGNRDQISVLFDDYVKTSNNHISYEFVNPDNDPILAKTFKAKSGDIVIARLDKQGNPDPNNAQDIQSTQEQDITNAISRVSAYGDYRAYFLSVDDGLTMTGTGDTGMSILTDTIMTKRFGWKTQEVNFTDLTAGTNKIDLLDPKADGIVLVVAGGSKPLSDAQAKVITDYLDKGGKLILFGGLNSNDSPTALATSDNLSKYLMDKFGFQFDNRLIFDQYLVSLPNSLVPGAADFPATHYINQGFTTGRDGMAFSLPPYPITIAATAPANVTVTPLVRTSDTSYTKTPDQARQSMQQSDTDPKGPFIVAAVAENTQTKARVVLFGNDSVASDSWSQISQLTNLTMVYRSMEWATGYNERKQATVPISSNKPTDQPIFADSATLGSVNFLTVILIPFGILGIGVWMWWRNRERASAA